MHTFKPQAAFLRPSARLQSHTRQILENFMPSDLAAHLQDTA